MSFEVASDQIKTQPGQVDSTSTLRASTPDDDYAPFDDPKDSSQAELPLVGLHLVRLQTLAHAGAIKPMISESAEVGRYGRLRHSKRAHTGNPTKDQLRLMMQSLLADRFKFANSFRNPQAAGLSAHLRQTRQARPRSLRLMRTVLPVMWSCPHTTKGAPADMLTCFHANVDS